MNFLMASVVGITNLCGAVSVDTHGACVTSYVPKNGSEVIFMSQTGTGGIPLCWPWFAGLGPFADSRRHGLARYCEFELAGKVHHSSRDSELVFRLESRPDTRRMFPHDFELTVSVRLTDCLTISMTGKNTGKEPFKVTEALHPYFAVSDQMKCVIEGLNTSECRLVDPVAGKVLAFTQKGAREYYVWRPNPQSHLANNVSPIMPDDWRKFICIENGTFRKNNAYILNPGESHTLVRSIKLVRNL